MKFKTSPPKKPTNTRTLNIRHPFGHTLWFGLIIFATMIILFEAAARSDFVSFFMPSPSIGIANKNLDIKLYRLHSLVESEGTVDYVFLGTSMVNTGIAPEIFMDAYRTISGNNILCFNFGIPGSTPSVTSTLTSILSKLYHPKFLVLGITPFEFARDENKLNKQISENPWILYNTGEKNIKGFLCDKFYLNKYFFCFRLWMEYPDFFEGRQRLESVMSPYGYRKNRSRNIYTHPKILKKTSNLKKKMKNLIKSNLISLENIIYHNTSIIIVEMPLHHSIFKFNNNYINIHKEIIEKIRAVIGKRKIPFILTTRFNLIPDKGWSDYNHLNYKGAKIFNQWLAKQIYNVVEKGLIEYPFIKKP